MANKTTKKNITKKAAKKKSFLPEASRKLIADRLLDLIFCMIAFGMGYLVTGGLMGLEPSESAPLQYFCAVLAATLPVLARVLFAIKSKGYRIALGIVWAAACFGAWLLLHVVFAVL